MLCSGCHLIIDPDDHVNDSLDASVDAGTDASSDGGTDGGTDAGVDVGVRDVGGDACGMLPMGLMGPPCCWSDSDCPTDGPRLVCHGGMCGGEPGVCFPETGDGSPGTMCFLDTDCMSGRCMDGPNCGCRVPCEGMMPMPGTCM